MPFTFSIPYPVAPSGQFWGPHGGDAFDVFHQGTRVATIKRESFGSHADPEKQPFFTGYSLHLPTGEILAAGDSDILIDLLAQRLANHDHNAS